VSQRLRLAAFASHPIQYQAPIWRRLAKHPEVDLLVHYFSDMSVRGGVDPGFGVPVAWDQPLLEGYEHVFLSRRADLARPLTVTVSNFGAYLRRKHFDAVFINGYEYAFEVQIRRLSSSLGFALLMRPELSNIPKRSWIRRVPRNLYQQWFFAGVNAFGVIGEQARRSLRATGVPEEKMFFSPYAVDSDLFKPNVHQRESCRRRLGIPGDRFVLLFSGKLIPRKNPLLVLNALEQTPARNRVTFVVLGDGPDRSLLEQEGKRVLGENFLLAGFKNQSQLAPYYQAADIFVLPSIEETWGLVVNEAMHFGLPVVASDQVGCAADLVRSRETGLIFRSNDADDLARALQELIENDRLRVECSQNASRAIREYTPDNASKGIVEALDYCVAQPFRRPARYRAGMS